ncbi:hypothetical protein COP2_008827 [Malus domestica]
MKLFPPLSVLPPQFFFLQLQISYSTYWDTLDVLLLNWVPLIQEEQQHERDREQDEDASATDLRIDANLEDLVDPHQALTIPPTQEQDVPMTVAVHTPRRASTNDVTRRLKGRDG